MRKTTFLWLALAAICGGILFHTSQQVTDGRTRLAQLDEDTRKENETIRVLQAEWGYLNQPDRLEKLSRQYLDLAPLKGRQFAKPGDIAERAAPESPAAAGASQASPPAAAPDAAPAKAAVLPSAPEKPAISAIPAPPVAAAPAAVKIPAVQQTAEVPAAFVAPVVKIRAPAHPAATPKRPVTATRALTPAWPPLVSSHRDFNDLIKSLGVQ